MVKYVLVISQYYHSYIQKVCMVQADFIRSARGMIEELEKYKRHPEENKTRQVYYGDLSDEYEERIERVLRNGGRINLNDAGDIYFELSDSLDHLLFEIKEYEEKGRRSYEYNKRNKRIIKNVEEHHDSDAIINIIKKYFVIL